MVIQLKRGTAAAIATEDPTLAAGEPCIETDTGKMKLGDGATAWASLDYVEGAIKLDDLASPDDNTDLDVSAAAHGLAPKLPDDSTKFLNGEGNYVVPPGAGDVDGPASNTDAYIPQWDGADSKLLKDGLEFSIDGTLGDNSDTALPSEKAVKTYVDNHDIDGGTIT